MAKPPFHPENPVRQGELEEILTELTQKILDEVERRTAKRGVHTYGPEEIAQQTIDAVYRT